MVAHLRLLLQLLAIYRNITGQGDLWIQFLSPSGYRPYVDDDQQHHNTFDNLTPAFAEAPRVCERRALV